MKTNALSTHSLSKALRAIFHALALRTGAYAGEDTRAPRNGAWTTAAKLMSPNLHGGMRPTPGMHSSLQVGKPAYLSKHLFGGFPDCLPVCHHTPSR